MPLYRHPPAQEDLSRNCQGRMGDEMNTSCPVRTGQGQRKLHRDTGAGQSGDGRGRIERRSKRARGLRGFMFS